MQHWGWTEVRLQAAAEGTSLLSDGGDPDWAARSKDSLTLELTRVLQFSHGRHDDQIDSVSQYLTHSQRRYTFGAADVITNQSPSAEMWEWEFGPTLAY